MCVLAVVCSARAPAGNRLFSVSAVIEQLPLDLRDRFTEMREMDLQVQSMSTAPTHTPRSLASWRGDS